MARRSFGLCSFNAQFLLPIHKQNPTSITCTTYVTKHGFAVYPSIGTASYMDHEDGNTE